MRTIESQTFGVAGEASARLKLLFVETGKRYPFRVTCEHRLGDGKVATGVLSIGAEEDTVRELYDQHVARAREKGWIDATPRVNFLQDIPDPPANGRGPTAPAPAPAKRKPGRPRKVRA